MKNPTRVLSYMDRCMGSERNPILLKNICRQRKGGVLGCCARQRAFSLVELVIVIVIIGIVAAIAMPRFSNASRTATARSVAKTLKVINDAAELYQADHGCYPGRIGCVGDLDNDLAAMQLLIRTERSGVDSGGVLKFGPYIRPDGKDDNGIDLFPRNSYTDSPDFVLGRRVHAYTGGCDEGRPSETDIGWLLDFDEGSFNLNLRESTETKLSDVVKWAAPAPIIYGVHPFSTECVP